MLRSAISLPKLISHGAGPAHPAKTRRTEAPNKDVISIHFFTFTTSSFSLTSDLYPKLLLTEMLEMVRPLVTIKFLSSLKSTPGSFK